MTCFYRPSKERGASALWCRCDSCHWSGPFEKFSLYTRGQDQITLCGHYWCAGDQELLSFLAEEGWVR